jgi:hypothetical protein
METDCDRRALPRLGPFLVLAAGLGLWIDLGWFHRYHNADSLIPVLVSLYRWTPFYWDQNRVGMLVPLVALPFRHPLDNLLVQGWLVLGATLATPFLLARYALRSPAWPLAGAVAAGSSLLLSTPHWFFHATFGQQQYPVSLALGLGALLLTEAAASRPAVSWGRLLAALLLVLLASWVNAAVGFLLLPLAGLRTLLRRRGPGGSERAPRAAWLRSVDRETVLALGVVAAGVASCFAHRLLVPAEEPIGKGFQKVGDWPAGWWALARTTWVRAGHPHGWGYLALAVATLPLLVPSVRRRAGGTLAAAGAAVGSAVAYGLFMGATRWVQQNGFCARYWVPTVMFLQGALAIAAVAPLAAFCGVRACKALGAVAAAGLLLAVAWDHGIPSRARARAELDGIYQDQDVPLPERTAEVLGSRATHLVGGYWQVWVSVFHANLALYERGEERTIWGVADRCSPTWERWGRVDPDGLRVAALTRGGRPDPEAAPYLLNDFPPLEVVRRRSTLWELRARETVWLAKAPPEGAALVASWCDGFYPARLARGTPCRWCGSRGQLHLTNASASPRTVTLRMSLAGATDRASRLWIEGPLFSEELTLTSSPLGYARSLTVPPGRHVLQFSCEGPRAPDSSRGRPHVFCAGDFRLEEAGGPPAEGP